MLQCASRFVRGAPSSLRAVKLRAAVAKLASIGERLSDRRNMARQGDSPGIDRACGCDARFLPGFCGRAKSRHSIRSRYDQPRAGSRRVVMFASGPAGSLAQRRQAQSCMPLRRQARMLDERTRPSGVGRRSRFDLQSALKSGGMGLSSMLERVRLINGTISIDSKPLGGTTIRVRAPLAPTPT